MAIRIGLLLALLVPAVAARAEAPAGSVAQLAESLRPWVVPLQGGEAYEWRAETLVPIDGRTQPIEIRLARYDGESFDLDLLHPEYSVRLRRRSDLMAMALPHHHVVFLGRGEIDPVDHLAPRDLAKRLVSPESLVATVAPLLGQVDREAAPQTLAGLAALALRPTYDAESGWWRTGKAEFRFQEAGRSFELRQGEVRATAKLQERPSAPEAGDAWPGLRVEELSRRELERQLARGLRRALEIAAPGSGLTAPAQQNRQVPHGELRWIEGQRVVLLRGTPEEIGQAHGELLPAEARRCIDSVLYAFGTVQTIRTGRWFRHDLESAYARLAPHIPEDHRRETRALAASLGESPELAEALNVFPELFHCSGFAVFGKATADGKLYHGRVLDYMTTIGLQDSATTFVVEVEGKIPFANVGYAGFIGSVSGMNARAISLGEMGGRGEGKWDGAPMATLMRRALEECSTLDEVMALWTKSPRTCEYYYVFADGKTNRAVGVAATPEKIEFVQPGAAHPLLGDGIPDAVVLSAGSRLAKLRERVVERHGRLDAEGGQWLMSRPVAMQSNLHNVLFVPEDGVLYVANADHRRPAAERPYVRLDLRELLER